MQTPDLDELELCYMAHLDCFSQHMGLKPPMGQKITKMLSFPWKKEVTFSISFSLSDLNDTSHTDPDTWKPFSFHSCRQRSRSSLLRKYVCIDAPRPANSSTTARLICKETAVRNRSMVLKLGSDEDMLPFSMYSFFLGLKMHWNSIIYHNLRILFWYFYFTFKIKK